MSTARASTDPPVIGHVVDEHFVLDLRSVLTEDDELLARTVIAALAADIAPAAKTKET